MISRPNRVYRAGNPILARRLDGDNQSFGLKLLLIELGPFFVGGQEQGHSGVVGLYRAQLGILLVERRQIHYCFDHERNFVLVIVVQQDFPRGQELRWFALGLTLSRWLGHGCARAIFGNSLWKLLVPAPTLNSTNARRICPTESAVCNAYASFGGLLALHRSLDCDFGHLCQKRD